MNKNIFFHSFLNTLLMKRTMPLSVFFVFCLICTSFASCGPFPDTREQGELDLSPPLFQELNIRSGELMILYFNEPARILPDDVTISPELQVSGISASGNEVDIALSGQVPGREYTITFTCEDEQKNSSMIIAGFYGYNPDVPGIIINEFITQGSQTHPDIVELKILEDGNMGGVACCQGTCLDWDNKLIFPAFRVKKGDFILVHFKPQVIPEEIDETEGSALSGGLDASDTAYDFWVKEGTGLSGNNGVITLYAHPDGTCLLDGVLYSNRTSQSDEEYLGFGSKKVMDRALTLAQAGGWKPAFGTIRPEDGINPDDSTATRSMCRNQAGTDTDTAADWHIVPTGKASFGKENCEEVYAE